MELLEINVKAKQAVEKSTADYWLDLASKMEELGWTSIAESCRKQAANYND